MNVDHGPELAQVECTNRCTLKCLTCIRSYLRREEGDLNFEDFKSIVDQLNCLKFIDLTGFGEPLLNKDFIHMLKYSKSRGLYCSFNDSFVLLTPDVSKQLIDIGVDRVVASVDGSTKRTYEKLRCGANFEYVIKNLRSLVELKARVNQKIPDIWINFVVSNQNFRQITEMVDLAKRLMVTKLVFTNLIPFQSMERYSIQSVDPEIFEPFFRKTLDQAKNLHVSIDFNLFLKNPIDRCVLPWKGCFIAYDGSVYPCCFINEDSEPIGNLLKSNISSIWDSVEYEEIRRKIVEGIAPSFCNGCPAFYPQSEHVS